jgi:pimeloyl-ACP methyl ester carboxylesterase
MVSGAVFNSLVHALDLSGLRLIIPDLRGSGDSSKPSEGYSLSRYAEDVLAVADAVGSQTFVLIGHSMGGQIAQYVAATQPDRVRGLMLLCSVPASGIPLPAEARGLFRGSAQNRGMQQTILGLACKQLGEAERELLLDDAQTVCAAAIEQAFDAWSAGGFAERLGAITAPTLVVATDDPFLPPEFLRQATVAPIARARLALLPGPGHYPQVERPRETAALVESFLAGLSR